MSPEPSPPLAGADRSLAPPASNTVADRERSGSSSWIERVVASPVSRSAYASLVMHVSLGIVLAMISLNTEPTPPRRPLELELGTAAEATGPSDDQTVEFGAADEQAAAAAGDAEMPPEEVAAASPQPFDPAFPPSDLPEFIDDPSTLEPTMVADDGPAMPLEEGTPAHAVAARIAATRPVAGGALVPADSTIQGGVTGVPFASRQGDERGRAAQGRGGSPASEAAVERGLAWLAMHQAGDGSWRFDLSGCRCDGACRDRGNLTSTTASTAIAVLPFLGAGNTHLDGPYRETVSRALYYLLSRMQATPRGGDFSEGTMYGHGVTTLVLAEALGMTGDDLLRRPCREAVRFIETSQDLHGGGWRYLPGQAGDITVTAWQLAAMKSAGLAGVETSSPTIEGVRRFLDSVQANKGAAYGYRTPATKPCTSAIGLLCRMYTGWGDGDEALDRGITILARNRPQPHAIYHNFYLAQALVQSDHPAWPKWNSRNRDQIVALQARHAHQAGSWFFADAETAPGGRLAHTALAVLSLEVYYRLLPIYRQEAVGDGF